MGLCKTTARKLASRVRTETLQYSRRNFLSGVGTASSSKSAKAKENTGSEQAQEVLVELHAYDEAEEAGVAWDR